MNFGKNQKNLKNQKDPRFNWKTIFLAHSNGFSSKRLIGVLGALICFGLLITAFFMEKEVPDFADMVLITSTSLLGVDAFRGIFSKNTNK